MNRFNTSLLEGHTDVVLCLAKSADGALLVSGSKDKTARVWRSTASSSTDVSATWECVGSAQGHVESIGAVAVSKKEPTFLITASQDRTAKVWDLAALLAAPSIPSVDTNGDPTPPASLRSLTTQKIHDKDINSLDISPNDKLLASGSQDRTAKLFAITHTPASKSTPATASLSLLGTFKGHKRGVWSVKFSPADQCLATASGDRTVKLWSLGDFACIKVRFRCLAFVVECETDMGLGRRRSRDIRTRFYGLTSSRGACSSFRALPMDSSRSGTSRTRSARPRSTTTRRRCVPSVVSLGSC